MVKKSNLPETKTNRIGLFFVKRDYDILLKVLYLLLFFFIIPIEELNAFTGLIFGYGFKILDRGVFI